LKEPIGRELIFTWIFTAALSIITFGLSGKITNINRAKFSAISFIVICIAMICWYYIIVNEPPFNAGMTCIFAFLAFSLMFPWHPNEITGLLFLHLSGYAIFVLNTQTYFYKNNIFTRELPDYLHTIIVMILSFFFCYIVAKRERERETENYILLKEIEDKNKQMHKELELATRVHSRLIPHSASTRLADIAVTYVPMYYMGGDYAKFHFMDKNKLIFIICDITGHGVSAALLVNALNTEFERLTKQGKTPGDLLKEMDKFIVSDFAGANMYLTAFCGLLEYGQFSRKFTYSSYGHPPQYIYRAGNSEIEKISAQTSFLGLPIEDENIYQEEVPFRRGDQILLFTDGVIEGKNAEGKDYGDERLENFIRKNNGLKAEPFNQKLLKELKSFTGGELKDDVFVLNIQTK